MSQLLLINVIYENVLSHMDKFFKVHKIKLNYFEENMGYIHITMCKNIYLRVKHISNHLHLFIDNFYDKDANPHGDILLRQFIPRLELPDLVELAAI